MIRHCPRMLMMIFMLISSTKAAVYSGQRPIWSILICTLDERRAQFEKLRTAIQKQIDVAGLTEFVEICWISDNRQMPTGTKRNLLLKQSRGEYVCFVDDDDALHDNYVRMIFEKLLKKPDCVNLIGIITFDGKNPKTFLHSIKYNNKYCEENGVYYRPPNHLNPIKRSIAIQFPFPDIYIGEDAQWAQAIARSGLLQREEIIDVPYYFYKYKSRK